MREAVWITTMKVKKHTKGGNSVRIVKRVLIRQALAAGLELSKLESDDSGDERVTIG